MKEEEDRVEESIREKEDLEKQRKEKLDELVKLEIQRQD